MALKTTLEQIEEVQEAISKCLEAQSMGAGDKSLARASLDALQRREASLLARYQSEQSGGCFNKVRFDDPI